jgi:hypothetical protein
MGLLGAIFGRPKPLPVENLAALGAAGPGLESRGYAFTEKTGICLKKEGPTKLDLTGLMASAGLPVRYEVATDEYCCNWIILQDNLQATTDAVIAVCRRINEAKWGGDILCVAFEFTHDGRKSYWIYSRRGIFYPFVPQDHEHDVMRELRMQHAGTDIIPVEGQLARWYPIWGMPF